MVVSPFQTARSLDEASKTTEKNPDFETPTKPYMSVKNFNKWDLDNPPGLVSQFWIEHLEVIQAALMHWILNGINIPVLYQ